MHAFMHDYHRKVTAEDKDGIPRLHSDVMHVSVKDGKEVSAHNVVPVEKVVDCVVHAHTSPLFHGGGRRVAAKKAQECYIGTALLDFRCIKNDCTQCSAAKKPPSSASGKHLAVV